MTYKRIFADDGTIVHDASSLNLRIEMFMNDLVKDCAGYDLRDLEALVHSRVSQPVARELLARRHREECKDAHCKHWAH